MTQPTNTNPATDPTDPTKIIGPNGGTDDWQTKYQQMQRSYQALFDSNAQLQKDFDSLKVENEQLKQEATANKKTLDTSNETLSQKETAIQEKETSIASLNAQLARAKILRQYPQLIPLDDQGLFEGIPQDKLEEKLKAVNESIAQQADQKAQAALQNTPPGPGFSSAVGFNPNEANVDTIYDRLMAISGSKDPKDRTEYERLMALYIQLTTK